MIIDQKCRILEVISMFSYSWIIMDGNFHSSVCLLRVHFHTFQNLIIIYICDVTIRSGGKLWNRGSSTYEGTSP
uniref:Ovule protein n=1 Tax=Caenorhabditis tropicalis TaxID=1561998 RepID=A0A1I7V0D9_9PELO